MDTTDLKAAALHDSSTLDQGHAAPHPSDVMRLLLSVDSFLKRFDAKPTVKFATDRAGSEFFEFVLALYDAQLATHPNERLLAQEKAAEELVDTFYASFGAALRAGVTPAQVMTAWAAIIVKNDAKTLTTHELTPRGGIERRKMQE